MIGYTILFTPSLSVRHTFLFGDSNLNAIIYCLISEGNNGQEHKTM